jgi:hypothetical protein
MASSGSTKTSIHVRLTVDSDHKRIIMSSLSASPFGLLGLKSSLLQLWLRMQDHRNFSIGVILGLIILCAARYLASPYRKLPPGPRGYPIIGNILEMRAGQWLKFAEWHKKYGQSVASNSRFAYF